MQKKKRKKKKISHRIASLQPLWLYTLFPCDISPTSAVSVTTWQLGLFKSCMEVSDLPESQTHICNTPGSPWVPLTHKISRWALQLFPNLLILLGSPSVTKAPDQMPRSHSPLTLLSKSISPQASALVPSSLCPHSPGLAQASSPPT